MIKVALILDDCSLAKWQRDALDAAQQHIDIRLVLSCQNTKTKKQFGKNFLYYVLNFFTLRNQLTARSGYDAFGSKVIKFDSQYDGAWQKIPESVASLLHENEIEVVIKFGMALLRIDKNLEAFNIFSFHHGDPSEYRGRPAGFYELLANKNSVGTIVQSITDKLDAGKIWAICHSKINHHSYKKTSINFYQNSKYLLSKALVNYRDNTPVDLLPNGRNYKLPGNFLVLKFIFTLTYRKLAWILYGVFCEKKWNIVTYDQANIVGEIKLNMRDGNSAKIAPRYSFYADPFFSVSGDVIRLEALNIANGQGDIIEIGSNRLEFKQVLLSGDHYSYPLSFTDSNTEYLFPEVASHSSAYILKMPSHGEDKNKIKGMEDLRIVDATLYKHQDMYYIFYCLDGTSSDCLNLHYARSLDDEFVAHPLNPVVIDPARARMGGRIIVREGKMLRFGQNNSFGYGNGVTICEIAKLSPTEYEEKVIGRIGFNDASGPHTIDVSGSRVVLDYYIDRFSLFAWYRRLVPLLLRKLRSFR